MNDLLGTVKGKGNTLYDGDLDEEEGFTAPPTEEELQMQQFFQQVEDIKKDMTEIKLLQKEVVTMHEKSKTIVKQKDMQRHREAMQDEINKVNKLAQAIGARMKALDADNEAAKKKKGQGVGSASERTRTTITAGLKKKLKDLMGEFNDLRNRIHEEYREVVERRVYTVTGQHAKEEELDRIIQTGESENIFQKAILEQGRGRVLDTVAEIQERHRAVKDLEQSMLELHQMFLDMATLVEAQGEMLDNIQKQVARSVDYVKGGTEALVDAKQYQKNTRKWMCCAIIILLIIALIIVLAVVKPWTYIK